MRIYKSELFGEILEPENFIELMGALRTNIADSERNVRIWRGQADVEWLIHSGAYRRIVKSGRSYIKERDVISYETHLLGLAKHKGFGFENGRVLSDFELLAKLQHHGAATRLVDFSKNSLVALWFCVDAYPDKTGVVIGVHINYIAGETEGNIKNRERTYKEFVDRVAESNNTYFIEPPVVSSRIASQHGVFLYSRVVSDNRGSLILPYDETGDPIFGKANNAVLLIAISPSLKRELKQILNETFDIRFSTLFPDLDGFSISNGWNKNTDDMWRW